MEVTLCQTCAVHVSLEVTLRQTHAVHLVQDAFAYRFAGGTFS
jgi:hypothetical protein